MLWIFWKRDLNRHPYPSTRPQSGAVFNRKCTMALPGEWHILRAHAKDEGHFERFHSRGQHLCKFIGTKETKTSFHGEKTNQFNELLPVGMLVSLTGRALHRYRSCKSFVYNCDDHHSFKRKFLHKKKVQLPQDWFGTPTWPPWRHVKMLYIDRGKGSLLEKGFPG